ncbi:MAG TPA: acyltransferase family protein, partial [Pyrinomonadaceae bacterium]|nr:acyltransferase family protein [Pyrinomonadaceae bacterium]
FVISGFCIHLQWAKSRAAGVERQIEFGSFWRRRLRRLYPPYLIAFALFMLMAAATTGINITHFFVYDVVMHLLMLHNLEPQTCYSINGVFWTLAVEEQLYLAYFLLLFLRKRWGWRRTLLVCMAVRVGWFIFSHWVWVFAGKGVPVPEAAASHWFTWALGAIAVEATFGLVTLPSWCRNIWLGAISVVAASAFATWLPSIPKDTLAHDIPWLLIHPLWGFGFFVIINRAVAAEHLWTQAPTLGMVRRLLTRILGAAAAIGVFSYSLYLTHELVVMASWTFTVRELSPIVNALAIVVPATVGFAWLFFRYCERPYMRKPPLKASEVQERFVRNYREEESGPVFVQTLPAVADEA